MHASHLLHGHMAFPNLKFERPTHWWQPCTGAKLGGPLPNLHKFGLKTANILWVRANNCL